MGVNNNGRPIDTLDDWMRNIEKRLMREERRPTFGLPSTWWVPGWGRTPVR
jgi:hypothetical protein